MIHGVQNKNFPLEKIAKLLGEDSKATSISDIRDQNRKQKRKPNERLYLFPVLPIVKRASADARSLF